MKRALTLALIVLLACSAVVPAAAATTADTTADSPAPDLYLQTDNESAGNETDTNETETNESATNESAPPSSEETYRLSPVNFGEGFLGTDTRTADTEFGTTGPFALFTTTEELDSARIAQSAAEAQVLGDGRTVFIQYDAEAAPDDAETYYGLELFFDDGSETTVDLYASGTDVSVEAAKLSEYSGFINYVEDQADGEGYETSPDGAQSYVEDKEERAQLLDNYLVSHAQSLLGLAIAAAMNPLAWLLVLGTIAVAMFKREQSLGWMLDRIENDAGEAQRKLDQLKRAFEKNIISADEEPLTELDAIGPQQAAYWKTTFGVTSVRQLAEIGERGRQVRADGGKLESPHDGVDSLSAEELHESWLEPILRSNRLSTPREALSHIRAACIRMDSKYGMGHRYRETRAKTEELLAETNPEGAAGDL